MFLLRLRPFLPVAAVVVASLAGAQDPAPPAQPTAAAQAPNAAEPAADAPAEKGPRAATRDQVRALGFRSGDVRMVRYIDASGTEVTRYFEAQTTSDTEMALIEVEPVASGGKGAPERAANPPADSPEMMAWLMTAMGFTALGNTLPADGDPPSVTGLDGQRYRFGPKAGSIRPQRFDERPAGPGGEKATAAVTWRQTETGWERGPDVRSARAAFEARQEPRPAQGNRPNRPRRPRGS